MLVWKSERVGDGLLGLAARRYEIRAQRLHVAALVPGSALQDRRAAVPVPWCAEAGERLRDHWRLQRRLRPRLAAVGRHHHLGDPAGGRIGDAGDLVEAWTFERHPVRRAGDEGLDLVEEVEPVRLLVRKQLRVGAGL